MPFCLLVLDGDSVYSYYLISLYLCSFSTGKGVKSDENFKTTLKMLLTIDPDKGKNLESCFHGSKELLPSKLCGDEDGGT